MIKNICIPALFISFLLLVSCEEEGKIKIDNYVVNSMFSDGVPFVIQTTNTVSVFDTTTYNSVKDFEGKLFEDDKFIGKLSFQDSYKREGLPGEVPEGYSIPGFVPKQGKEYRFELKKGEVFIQGKDKMPNAVPFSISDTSTVIDDYDLNTEGIQCEISFDDPADEENFYLISYNVTEFLSESDMIGWTQAPGWMKSDDPAIENNYYHVGLLKTGYRFIFSDRYFDGKKYTLPVKFFVGHKGERRMKLNIYLVSISKQYYQYVSSAIKQQKNNEDYYAEPTQVYNNIEGGFGVFAGFSSFKRSLEFGGR